MSRRNNKNRTHYPDIPLDLSDGLLKIIKSDKFLENKLIRGVTKKYSGRDKSYCVVAIYDDGYGHDKLRWMNLTYGMAKVMLEHIQQLPNWSNFCSSDKANSIIKLPGEFQCFNWKKFVSSYYLNSFTDGKERFAKVTNFGITKWSGETSPDESANMPTYATLMDDGSIDFITHRYAFNPFDKNHLDRYHVSAYQLLCCNINTKLKDYPYRVIMKGVRHLFADFLNEEKLEMCNMGISAIYQRRSGFYSLVDSNEYPMDSKNSQLEQAWIKFADDDKIINTTFELMSPYTRLINALIASSPEINRTVAERTIEDNNMDPDTIEYESDVSLKLKPHQEETK